MLTDWYRIEISNDRVLAVKIGPLRAAYESGKGHTIFLGSAEDLKLYARRRNQRVELCPADCVAVGADDDPDWSHERFANHGHGPASSLN